tara:strand:- start:1913 stop:2170 length:258 start_codon:yes stop_codon:yes gene_type:complete
MRNYRCTCEDCLNMFYDDGGHHYSNDHALYHHPKCNHITQKEFDKIMVEEEVWDAEYQSHVSRPVVLWKGYRCTCEEEHKKEEEE